MQYQNPTVGPIRSKEGEEIGTVSAFLVREMNPGVEDYYGLYLRDATFADCTAFLSLLSQFTDTSDEAEDNDDTSVQYFTPMGDFTYAHQDDKITGLDAHEVAVLSWHIDPRVIGPILIALSEDRIDQDEVERVFGLIRKHLRLK